jgi:hypothetical protein
MSEIKTENFNIQMHKNGVVRIDGYNSKVILYDIEETKEAAEAMLKLYDEFKGRIK